LPNFLSESHGSRFVAPILSSRIRHLDDYRTTGMQFYGILAP
jgi:hypothetical protein